ncbi:MAG: dihydroorotase [Bacteroidia bacterium]|nr:dihydroorotase [Bacteroidia bacterium]
MSKTLIREATVVNEGKVFTADVMLENDLIIEINSNGISKPAVNIIDARGLLLMPGLIDDQVHFREPGLTHKGTIYSEARAAVAGGITSFMEMPNTVPQATNQAELQKKYEIGAKDSLANYSFFMGATNDNLDEVLRTDASSVCGVKIFMGSSTGNMLVDNPVTLDNVFAQCPMLIATHCEDEETIKANLAKYIAEYGDNIPFNKHPLIRSREACYRSSSMAVELAKKHNTRLHILHISTAEELDLFSNNIPLEQKRITSEACIHHLWFSEEDYDSKGSLIKWNPAIKKASDRDAILQAVLDNRIDVIATDHAPHTLEEKSQGYLKAPSGGPLVQHALQAMLELHKDGKISLEKIVEKMCHHPAILFRIKGRGFIREGYKADLVLVDPNHAQTVTKSNILYHCRWSPFEGYNFGSSIQQTFVNGHSVWLKGKFDESKRGERLRFVS